MDEKRETGGWTFSPQVGTPGHCHLAQVWDDAGKALATIESTDDPSVASERARLIAAAPDLLEAAKTVIDGLHRRIDAARDETPVFDGIAALHDAISKAEPSQS